MHAAREVNAVHGDVVTFSPKVFIPLTQLCRDHCTYCTYRREPGSVAPYLEPEAILAIARAGERAGAHEALFVLGERPEARYPEARAWLAARGYASSIAYLAAMCELVLRETSLLPHSNAGTLSRAEIGALRTVNASLGLMIESTSEALLRPGGAHAAAPSKHPRARLRTLERAGAGGAAFTTGLLIGIGDTLTDQIDGLLAIRELHERFGHIQEVIVQNFRRKPATGMRDAAEPARNEVLRVAAFARLILGPNMNVQVPPNLAGDDFGAYLEAGINDWGGVSAVTPDHVNPEAPWPHLATLATETTRYGKTLRARLPIYPEYVRSRADLIAAPVRRALDRVAGADGYPNVRREEFAGV